jgi:predicted nucleic acid-binding protein
VATELLLDTGPLVSLLDRSQRRHDDCVSFFEAWDGAVVTTEAVLTEATHLLGRTKGGREACLDFIIEGGAQLAPPSLSSLRRARELVARYADLPMDYADATLVVLAEELGSNLVFTLDRRGFETYRLGRRRHFKIVP